MARVGESVTVPDICHIEYIMFPISSKISVLKHFVVEATCKAYWACYVMLQQLEN